MNHWNSNQTARNDEKPPFSRLFIVCDKQLRKNDLIEPFEKYGTIEHLHMPKDRSTGESKGVAYIKYSKTSSAAAAMRDLHLKTIDKTNKPIKVMLAANKNDGNSHNTSEDRYRRLFIKVKKDVTESDIRNHFSEFGYVDSVSILKDRATDTSKGFAYVVFNSFYDAAKAIDECDSNYKPVFATPRDELKRSRNSLDHDSGNYNPPTPINNFNEYYPQPREMQSYQDTYVQYNEPPLIRASPKGYTVLNVMCSPHVSKKHLTKLFNIIPGMTDFDYSVDYNNGLCKATVTYKEQSAAAHAFDRLNQFEFPSGELVMVQPDTNPLSKATKDLTSLVNNFKSSLDAGNPDILQLADAIAKASSMIAAATGAQSELQPETFDGNICDVQLPPPKRMACASSTVAQRCFIVCRPHPPPISALRDVFSRFGDLIDVSIFPNKTFGFAKYATAKAAQEAMKTLHGALVCGVKLKVLEADEQPSSNRKSELKGEHNGNDNSDNKRIRLTD